MQAAAAAATGWARVGVPFGAVALEGVIVLRRAWVIAPPGPQRMNVNALEGHPWPS